VSTPKKVEAAAVELEPLQAGGPDERLFIVCACQHRAAFHHDHGCQWVTPAKPSSSSYTGQSATPEVACTCPTPREVVYISGRAPQPKPEQTP
jgi:hypothetical protein